MQLAIGGFRAANGPLPFGDGSGRSQARRSVPLAMFVLGVVLGLGATHAPLSEFAAGIVILVPLGVLIASLSRLVERSDDRLIAGEASYRAFFEHAVEGIFRSTPDGHYLDANQALAEIYGYHNPRELMSGLTDIAAQLYVDPGRRDAFRALLQANDQVTDFISEIRRRDGSTIWISENARAVRDWTGKLVCYEGTVENVTAKFETERAMRRALREAEEASRTKSAFLAAMSHELKTPLNAVLGFSEILKDEMFGPLGQDAYRTYANDIHASGKRLLAIVNDVLDVSRIEGGAITINARACDPLRLAEDAVRLARAAAKVARKVEIVATTGAKVSVDPDRLRQALVNLLSNALKFTPEDGRIALHISENGSHAVCFAVKDTGIGMAPEKVAAALEPFRQLDGSLARRFEGAGLGLPIAKALVELHGGMLALESAAGTGTTVTIALPPARTVREGVAARS